MVGSTPGPRWTYVVADRSVFQARIRNTEDIGNRGHSATTWTTRSPRTGLPGGHGTVFLRSQLDAGVGGRPGACDFQFRVTLQHVAHWLAIGFLGNFGRENSPAVGRELAAESPADMVLMNSNVRCRNFQRFGHLPGNARNILGGEVREQVILIGPLGN